MTSFYSYNFNIAAYDGYLDFVSPDITKVTNNLIVNSNITCSHINCSSINNASVALASNLGVYNSNNIASLSNYVYNIQQTDTTGNVVFKDALTLKTSSTSNYNIFKVQNINNDLIASAFITAATSNTTLASYAVMNSNDWNFYGATPKIKFGADIWTSGNNVYTNRVVCGTLYYDSWIQGAVVDAYASNIFANQQNQFYAIPSYLGTRRIIVDSDGYIPNTSIKGLPSFKSITDSITGAVVGSTVATGVLSFGLGAAAGFLFKASQNARSIPRPPNFPSLTNAGSLNGGTPGTTTTTTDGTNPTTTDVPNNAPRDTDTIPTTDQRTGWPRRDYGSSMRRLTQETSRCCGCFRTRRTALIPNNVADDMFVNPRGGPAIRNIINPLFDEWGRAIV